MSFVCYFCENQFDTQDDIDPSLIPVCKSEKCSKDAIKFLYFEKRKLETKAAVFTVRINELKENISIKLLPPVEIKE
jgi:hypothetical protein